ncbi:rhodanese-related sulfurtransferase [Mariniflexile fucanivorans]|uniref:Rhodanese-related sulfurtransferase n=1 Tax=Mariniflexile fucanivorans TaxID=264023 RepID=A0A4V2QEE8_9FLAO|nr:rhodanese-like domain-containing protein [Mariniflexile fucanivorans]TCL67707.1 rhodanese-related sulfurtransferase [Mariniflexile fucanivorans]
MKELEKVKNISIASTLFILAVIIGLLTYKRPKNTFALNTKTALEKITSDSFFVPLVNVNNQNYKLIDVRSSYEFDKGHLDTAINISTPEILKEANLEIFKSLKKAGKTVVLYGNNPEEVNTTLLILYQLGYNNVKLLKAEISYLQNRLITKNSDIEKSEKDIAEFIKESTKNADSSSVIQIVTPPKKVITVKQKKKKTAEGGC